MSMKITKVISEDIRPNIDYIDTLDYGRIKVKNKVNRKYTYFDTVDGYDLYISETGDDTIAVREAINKESDYINTDVEKITTNYKTDIVKYDDTIPAIIVKVQENEISTLDDIEHDFKNNKAYTVKRITPQVLFLEINDVSIQLEDDNLLNNLSDDAVKKIATDLGADSNDTKNKDSAVGYIKGKLSNSNNN